MIAIDYTRDRGSTRRASARRREGDRFESRSDTASQLKTLKIRLNSLPCTVRTSQTKVVQSKGGLKINLTLYLTFYQTIFYVSCYLSIYLSNKLKHPIIILSISPCI